MRRTRDRFPEIVGSVSELPALVAESIPQSQPVDAIRVIIRIPPGAYPVRRAMWGIELPFGWRQTPERFLAFGERVVTVLEAEEGAVTAMTSAPLAALFDIHLFQELLYSWVEFVWGGQDSVDTIKVEYNSVGSWLIWRGITCIRESFPCQPLPEPESPSDIDLTEFPFKFKSYLRSSLITGERLVAAVYQPAIRPATRRWRRFISPNRVIAVTDRNILVIEDQRNRFLRRDRADADYAIVRHFFPLDRLQQAAVEPGPDADQIRIGFGHGAVIHDMILPVAPPRAQRLCDVLCARA